MTFCDFFRMCSFEDFCNKSDKSNASYDNRNMNTTVNQETKNLQMLEKSRQQEINPRMGLTKPNMPNFNDINQGCSNVVFNEYPMQDDLYFYILAGIIISIVGFYDDLQEMSSILKLFLQIFVFFII